MLSCRSSSEASVQAPFFESLAKKPPTTMDDLFRRANKYSMLEDDVRAATQQVLVAGQASRVARKEMPNFRTGQGRPKGRKGQVARKGRPSHLFPYHMRKLLPMIQGLSDFRWPRPLGTDPSKRDHSKRCAFHKEHGHNRDMQVPPLLVERLIKAGHLKQYLRSDAGGGPRPIDGTIIFPPVDPPGHCSHMRRPHPVPRDRRLRCETHLVDPGSSADLVQASVVSHMGHSLTALKTLGESYPDSTGHQLLLGNIVLPVQAGPVTLNVQFSVYKIYHLQCHLGAHMATLHESHPLYISSNARRMHPSLSPAMTTNSNYWVRRTKIPGSRSLANNPNFGRRYSPYEYQFPPEPEENQNMQNALRQNHDVFAWAHSDMKGIHPSLLLIA
ncbi:hypothetical protein CK203_096350 [Vitis vinifera]|uniref:Uncharacterized protein n=1 Tax=Vitis vinifera TaxID=29760 RepID=A0A438F506_VITVI|nr:hypothetical protein CK203_096350 [Vitis vinifera]